MEHLYLEPAAVAIWTVVILVSFVLMLSRVCASLRHIRAYRLELVLQAQRLCIHRMLSRAGTTLSRYLRRARPIDVEIHLLACQNCQMTEFCDKYLDQGEGIDPRTFCPNFVHLARHAQRRR